MAKGAIDLFNIYQFLKRLITPFDKWDAYKAGVINADGVVIIDKNSRTPEQDNTWGYYDRLVANLKKLLAKVPGGKTRLASFAAALLLLKEKNIDPDDLEYLEECLNYYMHEANEFLTEEVANSVGAGNVAGISPGDDTVVSKKAHKKWKKKNQEKS